MPDPVIQAAAPTNKAVAATGGSVVGAAVATLVLYGLKLLGLELPPEVAAAITSIVTAVITMAAAYFTPPGTNETVGVDAQGNPVSAKLVAPAAFKTA